jgi:predicted transcriptional regulator
MKTITRPKVTRENFTIRMQPNLKKALKIKAVEEDRDPSDLIEDAVNSYLAQNAS